MNSSLSTDTPGLSPFLITLRTCFIFFVGLLIISGNLLSITVTRRMSNLADGTKFLMTSLALADLLIGVEALLNVVASALDRWPFGHFGCEIVNFSSSVSFDLSVASIILLNMERYIAVTRPYRFPVWCSRRRIIMLELALSSVSVCKATTILLGGSAQYYAGPAVCFKRDNSTILNTLELVLIGICPTLTMTCMYCRIIQISRQHERRVNPNGPNGQEEANNIKDNKALKTFLVVTLTFATCCTPSPLTRAVASYREESAPDWLDFVVTWLAFSNSAFNVFIYCLFNRSYRQTAKNIISQRLSCCRDSLATVNI